MNKNKKKKKKEKETNWLANAEGYFEGPLKRSIAIESLQGLHAQVAVARIAVAQEGVQMPSTRTVSVALVQRPRARALVDDHPDVTHSICAHCCALIHSIIAIVSQSFSYVIISFNCQMDGIVGFFLLKKKTKKQFLELTTRLDCFVWVESWW